MDPIDFGGHMPKVKVIMDLYCNSLMNTIETEQLCASSSNFADILAMTIG